ncbi:MAG: deoxyribose-phosphate aldolase [Ardenticatenaceae bacterium]|nr:deoxyribose-phosphate aldolase [Ardenticatenaceae bacterium]
MTQADILAALEKEPGFIARLIDHTILKAFAAQADVNRICNEALQYSFASVCVNPVHVAFVAEKLAGSPVKVCSVVGFPLGATTTAAKVAETQQALADGAHEIDMVLDIGALKDGRHATVQQDIAALAAATHAGQGHLKVIIETCYLNDEEKEIACRLAQAAGADFVKTSTGFGTGGATEADVALMRGVVGQALGVKASGGIRSLADALAMVRAGANRIGASSGVAIMQEALA